MLPLRRGQQQLGAVVLGLDAARDIEELNSPGCYQLGWAVAASLAACPAVDSAESPPLSGALVRKITHEIRTPLTAIKAAAGFMPACVPPACRTGHKMAGKVHR